MDTPLQERARVIVSIVRDVADPVPTVARMLDEIWEEGAASERSEVHRLRAQCQRLERRIANYLTRG